MKRHSLGSKLTVLILLMSAILSAVTVTAGHHIYRASMERQHMEYSRSLASVVAGLIDPEAVDGYLRTLEADGAYEDTLRRIRMVRKESGALYAYVIKPLPGADGYRYVFDSDESENHFGLGHFEKWRKGYDDVRLAMYSGERVSPKMRREEWGWVLAAYEPVYGSGDEVKAYAGVEYLMDSVAIERKNYLSNLVMITVLITVSFAALFVYVIRRSVVIPISAITRAADDFLVRGTITDKSGASSISSIEVRTNDELQRLADAMKSMERKINEYIRSLNIVTVKAETDALTRLWNRDTFRQRVELYLRDDPPHGRVDAFLMVDVDYFKEVNDTHGHIAGDSVLVECARTMRHILRDSDIVARQGGDEFVVFCKSVGNVGIAENKARQILEVWREMTPQKCGRPITASIGISISPRDGMSYDELFRKADKALYKAKHLGRDRYEVYTDDY
jgi:diguanylate cyclase (GGDEF)-like protein